MERWIALLRRIAFRPTTTLTPAAVRLINVPITPKLIDTEDTDA